jgi:hypothetical protein
MWLILQVGITLVGCALYVVRTYGIAEEAFRKFEVVFGTFVALDLLLHWYADDSR